MTKEHRVLSDPSPDNLRAFYDEFTRMKRALNAFTRGDQRLEEYAGAFGTMNMKLPEEAVRACRKHVFGEQYLGAPLCQIEQDIVASRPRVASILVAGYEVVARSIERQLQEQAASAARPPEFPPVSEPSGAKTPSAEDIKRSFSGGAGAALARPLRRK